VRDTAHPPRIGVRIIAYVLDIATLYDMLEPMAKTKVTVLEENVQSAREPIEPQL
jgi:hypothetical protein